MATSKQLVLAFFDNEAAADAAASALKEWDHATDDIKLGAIGLLVTDENGKVKTHKLGPRSTRRGAGIGTVLGILAGVLSGGMTVLGGVVGGALLGGIVGTFFHKGLNLSDDDLKRIGSELESGHAAVAVLVENPDAERTTQQLGSLGGKPEVHEVSASAVEDIAAADATAVEEQSATGTQGG